MWFKLLNVRTIIAGVALTAGIIMGTISFGPAIATNFSNQSNAPIPVFPKNENGQTYGSSALVNSPDQEPDLISAVGEDGTNGYVRSVDLNEGLPKTPQEAIAYNKKHQADRQIALYAVDGKTVIGVFNIHNGGKITEIPAGNENKKATSPEN